MSTDLAPKTADEKAQAAEANAFLGMTATSFSLGGKTIEKKKLKGKVSAYLSEMTSKGGITIKFDSSMNIPKSADGSVSLSFYEKFDAIKFQILYSDGTVSTLPTYIESQKAAKQN